MLHKWFVQWFSFPSSNLETFKYEFKCLFSIQEKKSNKSKFKKNIKEYFYRLTCNQGNETYPNQLKYKVF